MLTSLLLLLLQSTAELPAWAVLSSAGLGGIAYWLVIFPVDVIKSSMQTDNIIPSKRRYTTMLTSAKVRKDCRGCSSRNTCIVSQQHLGTDTCVHMSALLLLLLQLLWAEGGLKRFYKGFTPCLIRAAPANGAMLYTVDKVTNLLNKE